VILAWHPSAVLGVVPGGGEGRWLSSRSRGDRFVR